ncbi:MAG: fluoride efflux transporter CrcB [Candidatus Aenigmatarchaeota archaeon]
MTRLLFVGLGGFLGAMSRYLISGWAQELTGSSFPLGTLVVNVAGSFFLAFLAILAFESGHLPVNLRLFFLTGMLGAFTTYSTFSYETLQLMRDSLHRMYLLNIASNTIFSLAGAWLGFIFAHYLKG